MKRRILLLIAYRLVVIGLLLLYHLVALLFSLPVYAMEWVLSFCLFLAIWNGFFYFSIDKKWAKSSPRSFVFFQFTIDILAISLLLILVGSGDTGPRFAYLVVILLSAVFLDKISIYAITVLSMSFYLLSVQVKTAQGMGEFWSVQLYEGILSQMLFCLLTALLSTFMQSAYLSSREAVRLKEERILWLRNIRRQIIENLPSGLLICDEDGSITFANPVSLTLLGQTHTALIGRDAWHIFQVEPPAGADRVKKARMKRLETTLTIGNSRKILGLGYTGMERESGELGYMIVFQDLTHVKILEQQRQLSDRMGAIAKVAAGVAHEIRNPLAAISGSIQVLKDFVPEDETALELVDIVDRETKRLNNILSDFLAYARPSAISPFQTVDLKEAIEGFVRLTGNDAQIKTLDLRFESDGLPAPIQADEARLTQIWWNLLRNAYQASDEGGVVQLRVDVEDDTVCFTIRDYGVGMNEAQLSDLFTPFQSFSKSGSGLGMSIVYDIVKLHHGEIAVESTPGEGTEIVIRFPKFEE